MVDIACLCPPTAAGQARHPDGDRVDLRDTLDFRQAMTVRNAVRMVYQDDPDAGWPQVLAAMSETYALVAIRSWTLLDDRGKPLPVNARTIRDQLLVDYDAAEAVTDAADALYSARVILPLLVRASNSSPHTRTGASTSPKNGSKPSRASRSKPSKPSWTTTTPTDATGPMAASPAGDSS